MKVKIQKIVITMFGITISYFGAALAAFVNIGQGPVSAFYLSMSNLTGVMMGTVSIAFQVVFLIGQIIIEKRNFKSRQCLQLLISTYGGLILNFFLYQVFIHVTVDTYFLRLLLGTFSYFINAVGVILVLEAGFVRVPFEGFLQLLAQKNHQSLGKYKQISDFVFIFIALLINIIFHQDVTIREGTIISALIFGPLLNIMRKPIHMLFMRNEEKL